VAAAAAAAAAAVKRVVRVNFKVSDRVYIISDKFRSVWINWISSQFKL